MLKMEDKTISYRLAMEGHYTAIYRDQMKTRKERIKKTNEVKGTLLGLIIMTAIVHLLALCVIILYQILQQIHTLFGLDFVNFNEILRK